MPRLDVAEPPEGLAQLDLVDWRVGLAFDGFGARIGVRVNRTGDLDLAAVLPFGWRRTASPLVDTLVSVFLAAPGGEDLLFRDGTCVLRTTDRAALVHQLVSLLDFAVAERATQRVYVHAGVVGWRDRAIVIPGRSLSGKTTLVTALVRAGATFYSDEFAVVDVDGLVHPHPRPLGVRPVGSTAPGTPVDVAAIGGVAGRRPLPVGTVVSTRFVDGATWSPTVLSASEGLLRVLDNAVVARTNPALALAVLGRAVQRATSLDGDRGDASATAAALLRDG